MSLNSFTARFKQIKALLRGMDCLQDSSADLYSAASILRSIAERCNSLADEAASQAVVKSANDSPAKLRTYYKHNGK